MGDFESKVYVNQALMKKLANAPDLVKKVMYDEMDSVVKELERITKEKVSGPVLKVQSGRLRSSIGSEVVGSGIETVGRFGVIKPVFVPQGKARPVIYAAVHEFGLFIPFWTTYGKGGKRSGGGFNMTKRSFIRSTAKEKGQWIRKKFGDAMRRIKADVEGTK